MEDLNISLKLHNYFNIIVEDVETGEESRFYAENIVTDTFYAGMFNMTWNAGGLITTQVGTGLTTPQKTDTKLENNVLSRTNNGAWNISQWNVGGTGVAVYTGSIQIETSELIGSVLTEVGLSGGVFGTRALIQDSNGNTISITKTDTMVVTIYATAYMLIPKTISGYPFSYRFNGQYFPFELSNTRIAMFNVYDHFSLRSKRCGKSWFDAQQRLGIANVGTASFDSTRTTDVANKKHNYSYASIPVGSGNIGGIRSIFLGPTSPAELGSVGLIEIPVPNDLIIQPVLPKEVIATADGITTEFYSTFGWIRDNATAKVYVNDIEQTSGITINYNKPPKAHADQYMENTGLTNSLGSPTYENVSGSKLNKVFASARSGRWLMASNSPSGVFEQVVYIKDTGVQYNIPEAFQNYKYWGSTDSYTIPQGGVHAIFEPDIKFDTPPAAGSVIALTYQPDCIAKDATRIINNISYSIGGAW